jgi:flagellar hook-associated protein 2
MGMPVAISGFSGIDTDGVVQKLVEVESRPIKQLEIRKKNFNIRKDSLKNLGNVLEDVNKTAKNLFGINSSYDNKIAVSSDPSVLEARASRHAEEGIRKIKIIQTATSHAISSDPVQEGENLPPARFTIEVNGEKDVVDFKGGRLKDIKDAIEESTSGLVSTSYIRKSGDTYILTIQSKKTGKAGEIKISGGMETLKRIGLVDGDKSMSGDETALTFSSDHFGAYTGGIDVGSENGTISVSRDGKTVTVKSLLWREYSFPAEIAVKDGMQLQFDVRYIGRSDGEENEVPRSLRIGPREKINIKGIILEGYNVNRMRKSPGNEESKKYDSLLGVGIIGNKDGKRIERIYPLDAHSNKRQVIALDKDFKSGTVGTMVVYCNRGRADFSNARMVVPRSQKGLLALKNVISKPQDAKVVVDGIEVSRDRNEGLNDIIKGVTLNLKRPSMSEVDLRIDHNIDAAVEKIRKFVDAYNKYLDFNKELTRAVKSEKPGEFAKTISQTGLFMGDITLLRLESSMKMTINNAYHSRAEKPIKVFAQMGVSTGAINAEWSTIQSGKLIVDETLLSKTIRENPEGVAMFFGSDTDGDNKADNGLAYKVVQVLKPYVEPGKNIIASKIDFEENSIKLVDENIRQKEDHLKKYEEKLKYKFGLMERAISESNQKRQWMKNQLEGISGNNAEANKSGR